MVARPFGTKLAGLSMLVAASSSLATPLIVYSPATPTTLILEGSDTAVVSYVVTSQDYKTTSWTMTPILGIVQLTGAAGECGGLFVLEPSQSCTLDLQLSAAQMNDVTQGGPIACQSGNPLSCYQPSAANQLKVTVSIFTDGFEP